LKLSVPDKILSIIDSIHENGSQELTRLTVLKKWFQDPNRLSAFSIFIAKRVVHRNQKSQGDAGKLFQEARELLAPVDELNPTISEQQIEKVCDSLHEYQNDTKKLKWARVRIIKVNDLFIIEEAFKILLWDLGNPSSGYRLAAKYCENYDPSYGNNLNKGSVKALKEIANFIMRYEDVLMDCNIDN
jgi:hypothetical protein